MDETWRSSPEAPMDTIVCGYERSTRSLLERLSGLKARRHPSGRRTASLSGFSPTGGSNINGQFAGQWSDHGLATHYFKYGCYGTHDDQTPCYVWWTGVSYFFQ